MGFNFLNVFDKYAVGSTQSSPRGATREPFMLLDLTFYVLKVL